MSELDMFSVTEMTQKDLSFLDKYELIWAATNEEVEKAFEDLEKADILGLDIETSGLSHIYNVIAGITIAPSETKSYYFPVAHKFDQNVDFDNFLTLFRKLCKTKKFVLFNGGFDWGFIYYKWGIDFEIAGDAQVSAYCLDSDLAESGRLNLKNLMKEVFNIQPLELHEDLGTYDFTVVKKEDGLIYAAPDSIHALMLYNYYKPKIKEQKLEFIEKLELNCIKPVSRLHFDGCALDTSVLLSQKDKMTKVIKDLETQIYRTAGKKFDLLSSQQMAEVLYDDLKLPINNKNTNRSVDKNFLALLEKKHPIIPLIQQFRKMTTLYENFVVKLPQNIAEDNRIHANFNATGTRSGRFSASGGFGKGGCSIKINLQQIPNKQVFEAISDLYIPESYKDEFPNTKIYDKKDIEHLIPENNTGHYKIQYKEQLKIDVRSAFRPKPGNYYVSCDYSQLEYRMLANLSGDDNLRQAYKDGLDFHQATASAMLNIPYDKVTKDQRKIGKKLNFALVYGLSDVSLAEDLGIPLKEASKLKENYFKQKPRVKQFIEEVKTKALKEGCVRTFFGRKRSFKELEKGISNLTNSQLESVKRRSFNTKIQGSAADLSKIALCRVSEAIKQFNGKVKLVTIVHDEYNFEVDDSIKKEDLIPVLDKALSFYEIEPGWCDFLISIEFGSSYSDTVDIEEMNCFDLPKLLPKRYGNKKQIQKQESLKDETEVIKLNQSESISIISKDTVQEQINLSDKKLRGNAVLLSFKDNVSEHDALSVLEAYIKNNFGNYKVLIQHEGIYYELDSEFFIDINKISELENHFNILIGKEKPRIKISL